MSALLPTLAFAAVVAAQFVAVIAARAVTQNSPADRTAARATLVAGSSAEYRP